MTFRRLALILAPVALTATTVAGCSGSSTGSASTGAPAPIATATQTVTSTAPPTGSGVAGSTSAGGGGGSAPSASSGPGLCTPTVMTFSVGSANGASGTQYVPVVATNASQSPCVTTGFPGVAVLNSSGGQYAQATRDQTNSVTTITVAPGQKIVANVGFSDVPRGGTGQCPNAAGFLFTLPDNTDSTKLAYDGPACAATVQAFTRYQG